MEDIKDLEFLAGKSKDFIEKQINSYRQKQANSGSIMAIISLFIPFFLSGLDDSYFFIKLVSVIPIVLFVIAIVFLIDVLKSKPLDQGFHTNKFQWLVNLNNYKQVLLYEIGANQSSFTDNKIIVDKSNLSFNRGVSLTLFAVLISISLLVTNKFCKPYKDKTPINVKIIN